MKNIQRATLDKYNNSKYELIENGIYLNKDDQNYFIALTYELEKNEDSQYPLEDILDKFYLHVSDFINEDSFHNSKNVTVELGGDLEDLQNATNSLIGKRAYNSEYQAEDGKLYVKLIIE